MIRIRDDLQWIWIMEFIKELLRSVLLTCLVVSQIHSLAPTPVHYVLTSFPIYVLTSFPIREIAADLRRSSRKLILFCATAHSYQSQGLLVKVHGYTPSILLQTVFPSYSPSPLPGPFLQPGFSPPPF